MSIDKKVMFENEFTKLTRTCYQQGEIMPEHTHEETAISLIINGSNHETVNEETKAGQSTQVVIKPAGIPHNNIFSLDCVILSIYLKQQTPNRIHKEHWLKEWRWIDAADALPVLLGFMQNHSEKEYYNRLNQLLSVFSHTGTAADRPIPDWLKDLKNYLDHSYHSVVKNEDLRKLVKKHPVYIARAFRKHFGQSISDYLKVLRVNAAMTSIIHDEDILAGVALRHGFSDQSHLTRTFKESTGLTPYAFRKLSRKV